MFTIARISFATFLIYFVYYKKRWNSLKNSWKQFIFVRFYEKTMSIFCLKKIFSKTRYKTLSFFVIVFFNIKVNTNKKSNYNIYTLFKTHDVFKFQFLSFIRLILTKTQTKIKRQKFQTNNLKWFFRWTIKLKETNYW